VRETTTNLEGKGTTEKMLQREKNVENRYGKSRKKEKEKKNTIDKLNAQPCQKMRTQHRQQKRGREELKR